MESTLKLFSYLFHPLFISVYAVLLYFIFGSATFDYPSIYVMVIQIVIITIFIPLTFYYLLLSVGQVDSIMISSVSQRRIPLIIHAILLMILLRKTVTLEVYPQLHFFFLGSLVSTCMALMLAFLSSKASLHMIGMAAITVFAVGISMHFHIRLIAVIVVLILCNGLVATSRLHMQAHTQKELLAGCIVGSVPQIVLLWFWL